MNHKVKVHEFFGLMSDEVLAFIKESESGFPEGWVPATYIKDQLELKMSEGETVTYIPEGESHD